MQQHGQAFGSGPGVFSSPTAQGMLASVPALRGGALPAPTSQNSLPGVGHGGPAIAAPVMPPPPFMTSGSGSYAAPLSSSSAPRGPRYYPVSDAVPSMPIPSSTAATTGSGIVPSSAGGVRNNGSGTASAPSSRIDPSQMPRPSNQNVHALYDVQQSSRKAPPSATASFVVLDGANCSPRHMRSTMGSPPLGAIVSRECNIPFAVVMTPFAPVEGPEETAVATVETVEGVPQRCTRCRGYINPAVVWVDNGAKWQCNLCSMQNAVPDTYYCSLDGTGLRMDRSTRPELRCGSVDFVVGTEYRTRPDVAPAYVFAIDISPRAMACGATMASLQAVEACIRSLRAAYEETKALYQRDTRASTSGAPFEPSGSSDHSASKGHAASGVHPNDSPAPLSDVALHARIGIFTFHRSIQFYSIRPDHREQVKMHIVDSWDPVAALPASLWLKSIAEQWEDLELMLQRLPELVTTEQGLDKNSGYNAGGGYGYSGTANDLHGACTGAAIKSAQLALENTKAGGRVFVLTPNSPSIGYPKITKRETATIYCSPTEVSLYGAPEAQPSSGKENEAVYKDVEDFVALASSCVTSGVCVDILLLLDGDEYRDTGMLGHVCDASGGSLYLLRGSIGEEENALRLERQLSHCLRRCAGQNAVCKVRTSTGFKLQKYHGKGVQRNFDAEVEFAGIDEETTFVGSFAWDGVLKEDESMHIQLAILYTDNRRRRLVRTHNLSLRASSVHATIFRGADLDAVAYTMVAQAVERAFTKAPSADGGPRDHIKITACDMLFSYRTYCSAHSPRGQLILPDSLKLLPLYCLGMLKHPAFIDNLDLRGKMSVIRGHERAYELRRLRSCPVRTLVQSLCPRVFECLKLSEATFAQGNSGKHGSKDERSWRNQLWRAHTIAALAPCTEKISAEALDSSGVHILDDGSTLYLHVGRACTRVELEEWFSVAPHARPPMVTFNQDSSDTAHYMSKLIDALQAASPYKSQLVVVWADEPATPGSARFAMRLVEDSLYGSMSYTDFLCKLHASIQTRTA